MSNTGFVDVPTAPAGARSMSVPGLGTFAPPAGPTIGPDGTVFLGTREGKLIALHANGKPYWNQQLSAEEMITSPPAVGADGSAYVVGSFFARDHRTASGQFGRARLYKFTSGGGSAPNAVTDFPQHDDGPTILGAPSIWRFGDDEAVIVPAVYPNRSIFFLRLLAFSTAGGIMAEWEWQRSLGDVELADTMLFPFPGFHPATIPPPAVPSWSGVTVAASPEGSSPWVLLVDRFDSTLIGFSFCVGAACSPAPGFTERFRTSYAPRKLLSSAVILPDNHTAIGSDDGLVFSGPNANPLSSAADLGEIYATPIVAADGRTVLVNGGGGVIGLRDGAVIARTSVAGQTIAGAAASRTHVFVATTEALYTLNATAEAIEFTFPWDGGGLWSPAVGPKGHVYAMASNILFIFPPPKVHIQDVRVDVGHRIRSS